MLGVFDGLGGEECGEIASMMAAEKAAGLSANRDIIKKISDYCEEVNSLICDHVTDNKLSSMGTTAALLIFGRKEIVLCNVGDSRIFRLSGKDMDQISYDHVMSTGQGHKPLLSQKLGMTIEESRIVPYISRGSYCKGDKYLLCSDGLTDAVSLDEIRSDLQQYDPKDAVEKLLEKALNNGGRDNITIIAAEIKRSLKLWG